MTNTSFHSFCCCLLAWSVPTAFAARPTRDEADLSASDELGHLQFQHNLGKAVDSFYDALQNTPPNETHVVHQGVHIHLYPMGPRDHHVGQGEEEENTPKKKQEPPKPSHHRSEGNTHHKEHHWLSLAEHQAKLIRDTRRWLKRAKDKGTPIDELAKELGTEEKDDEKEAVTLALHPSKALLRLEAKSSEEAKSEDEHGKEAEEDKKEEEDEDKKEEEDEEAGEKKCEAKEDEEEDDADPWQLAVWDLIKLDVGWLAGFLAIGICFAYLPSLLGALEDDPSDFREGVPQPSDFARKLFRFQVRIVDPVVVFVGIANFFFFAMETEMAFKEDPELSWLPHANRVCQMVSVPIICISIITRVLSASANPSWCLYGSAAPVLCLLIDYWTWLDVLAVVPSVLEFFNSKDLYYNILPLILIRTLEMCSRWPQTGPGLRAFRSTFQDEWRILLSLFTMLFVLWVMIGGLYRVAMHSSKSTSEWPAAEWKGQPYERFASIPSSMFYVLLSLMGEHPLADDFTSFSQRLLVVIVCILGVPIFGIPSGMIGYLLDKHTRLELERSKLMLQMKSPEETEAALADEPLRKQLKEQQRQQAAGAAHLEPAPAEPAPAQAADFAAPRPPTIREGDRFDQLDVDGDGVLTREEFYEAWRFQYQMMIQAQEDAGFASYFQGELLEPAPTPTEPAFEYGPNKHRWYYGTVAVAFGSVFFYMLSTSKWDDACNTEPVRILHVNIPKIEPLFVVIVDLAASVFFGIEFFQRRQYDVFSPPHAAWSPMTVIDLCSWLCGVIHAIAFLVDPKGKLVVFAAAFCVLRVLKPERYLGAFKAMYNTLGDSAAILRASALISFLIWLFVSSVLYFTERDNPDSDMTDNYGSVPRSLWAEIINLHGEWPWTDYSWQGKAVGTMICFIGNTLCMIPLAVFQDGLTGRIEEEAEEEQAAAEGQGEAAGTEGQGEAGKEGQGEAAKGQEEAGKEGQVEAGKDSQGEAEKDSQGEAAGKEGQGEAGKEGQVEAGKDSQGEAGKEGQGDVGAEDGNEHEEALEDEKIFEQKAQARWQMKLRPAGGSILFDTFYAHLLSPKQLRERPRSRLYRLVRFVSVSLTLAVTVSNILGSDPFMIERYGDIDSHLVALNIVAILFFHVELGARVIALRARYIISWTCLLDVISLSALNVTTFSEHRQQFLHPRYDSPHERAWIDLLLTACLLRIVMLENWVPAIQTTVDVILLHKKSLGKALYATIVVWYIFGVILYVLEKDSEDEEVASRYADVLTGLPHALIHVKGDYPVTNYRVASMPFHFVAILMGMCCLGALAGIFSQAVEDFIDSERLLKRQMEREKRATLLLQMALFVQRNFRRKRALASGRFIAPTPSQRVSFRMGAKKIIAQKTNLGKAFATMGKLALALNVINALLGSIQEVELREQRWINWVELVTCLFFLVEYAFHCLASPRDITRHPMRIIDFLCLLPFIARIIYWILPDAKRHDQQEKVDIVLEAFEVCRVLRVLDWPIVRRDVRMIMRAIGKCINGLGIPAVLALQTWVVCSGLFVLLENMYDGPDKEHMESMMDSLYWNSIYLLGEWANDEFSNGAGSRLCIVYNFFGVVLFQLPVGMMVQAAQNTLDEAESERKAVELYTKAARREVKLSKDAPPQQLRAKS